MPFMDMVVGRLEALATEILEELNAPIKAGVKTAERLNAPVKAKAVTFSPRFN